MRDTLIHRMTPTWIKDLGRCTTNICPEDGEPYDIWGGVTGRAAWMPARPMGFSSFFYRIKAAWLVFTGRADALIWPGDQ